MERAIQLPFSISSSGGVAFATSYSKVWQDRVVSVVMTALNERVMRPTYGSAVGSALFEPKGVMQSILQDAVEAAFSNFLPELTLKEISAYEDSNDPDGYVTLDIRFSYPQLLSQTETSAIIKTQILSRSGEVLLEVGNGR